MEKLFQNNTNVTYELDSFGNSVHKIEKNKVKPLTQFGDSQMVQI
jgi:hypothetical protein